MQTGIEFQHVSKQYRLGLSRVSVPAIIGTAWRGLRRNREDEHRRNQAIWAIQDVSFVVQPGQSLALIGPNGAGKTTILKLLARITRPTYGTINVRGRLSALIELGAGFHPDLTGRENVYLNGTILGLSRQAVRHRFDEIVDFSEVARFIDTPVKRYSSGMIVRLGFAVAACIQPEVLLVDEVLAVGDARFRQKCLQRIQSLVARGTCIVFVSHDLYTVRAVCDAALYVRGGNVVAAGPTRDVIEAYEWDVHRARAAESSQERTKPAGTPCELEITSVEICGGAAGPPDSALSSHDPATIRIHYVARAAFDRVNMSVFVKRADGLTCCMMRTSFNGGPFPLRPGTGTVSFQLERLQLITGTYAIDAYFLNDSDSIVLTPRGSTSDWFSVRGMGLSTADDSGVYEPVGRWSHE